MSFCCTDLLHIVMNAMICSVTPQLTSICEFVNNSLSRCFPLGYDHLRSFATIQGDGHYCTSSAPSKGGTTGMAGLYEDVMQKKLEKTWTWRKVPTDG